jgi:hypothetical protein
VAFGIIPIGPLKKCGEDSALLRVMETDLDELEKRASFLSDFHSTGGRAEYYISWLSQEIDGAERLALEHRF